MLPNEAPEPEVGTKEWISWAQSHIMNLTEELKRANYELNSSDLNRIKLNERLEAAEAWIKLRVDHSVHVIEVGTPVRIPEANNLKARIDCIHVDRNGTTYDVFYWRDGIKYVVRVTPNDIVREDYLPIRGS